MTDAEVAQIMSNPASVPDSDDEEDDQAWKVCHTCAAWAAQCAS